MPMTAESVWWQGALFTIKGRRETTGGTLGLIEVDFWDGMGTPLHLHHQEDEGFYILDGQIRFRRGDEVFTAGPGEFVSRRLRATMRSTSSRLKPPGSHAETWRRPNPDSNGCLSSTGQWIRTTCGVSWPSTSATTRRSFGVMSPSASLIRGGGLFHGRVLSGRGPGERSLREPGPPPPEVSSRLVEVIRAYAAPGSRGYRCWTAE